MKHDIYPKEQVLWHTTSLKSSVLSLAFAIYEYPKSVIINRQWRDSQIFVNMTTNKNILTTKNDIQTKPHYQMESLYTYRKKFKWNGWVNEMNGLERMKSHLSWWRFHQILVWLKDLKPEWLENQNSRIAGAVLRSDDPGHSSGLLAKFFAISYVNLYEFLK